MRCYELSALKPILSKSRRVIVKPNQFDKWESGKDKLKLTTTAGVVKNQFILLIDFGSKSSHRWNTYKKETIS